VKTYIPMAEINWSLDPNVEAARKHPAWKDFHRACAVANLYFDHMQKEGRGYKCTAFTLYEQRGSLFNQEVCTGRGKTVLESVVAAFRESGFDVPEALPLVDRFLGIEVSDFDALIDDDFEGLL